MPRIGTGSVVHHSGALSFSGITKCAGIWAYSLCVGLYLNMDKIITKPFQIILLVRELLNYAVQTVQIICFDTKGLCTVTGEYNISGVSCVSLSQYSSRRSE